jgi:hypothetical protein
LSEYQINGLEQKNGQDDRRHDLQNPQYSGDGLEVFHDCFSDDALKHEKIQRESGGKG